MLSKQIGPIACLYGTILLPSNGIVNIVTGTLGERGAERRDQAHQPFEPDLGKPYVALSAHEAEDERRESDRQTVIKVVRLQILA